MKVKNERKYDPSYKYNDKCTTPPEPPYSPYYIGNSGLAFNMGSVVKPASGSGMSEGVPSGGPGGGGGTCGPGGSGNDQFNNRMTVEVPAISGGSDRMGRSWIGGSLDPKDHD